MKMMPVKHNCEWLRNDQYRTEKVEFQAKQWIFECKLFASAEWVKDGEANEVGELLSDCTIPVNFCPYCGEKLNPACTPPSDIHYKRNIPSNRNDAGNFYQCPPLQHLNASYGDEVWLVTKPFFSGFQFGKYSFKEKEFVFQFSFSIIYCPFCGEPLNMRDVYDLSRGG